MKITSSKSWIVYVKSPKYRNEYSLLNSLCMNAGEFSCFTHIEGICQNSIVIFVCKSAMNCLGRSDCKQPVSKSKSSNYYIMRCYFLRYLGSRGDGIARQQQYFIRNALYYPTKENEKMIYIKKVIKYNATELLGVFF